MDGALQKTETTNLRVLTSGDLPPNPAELLGSDKMHAILRQVREEVDVILIDTPPIMAVTDAAVLAPKMDGVLLVVKPGVTKQAALRSCADQLSRVGANLLGVILNDVEFGRSRYGYNYYYKGYYYAYQEYYGDTNNKSPRSGRHKPQPQPAKTAE
jgi:capsular exopolysaccharide synthesis family protein